MSVNWQTLIADAAGVIDYTKVGKLVSILLAVLGGVGLLAAMVLELALRQDLPSGMVLIACGVLIAPLTGGHVADGISGMLASRRIQAGAQVSRRASDQTSTERTP